jgi:UDP-N-acetylmuramoyl-tripeptide--D-alanyl-D-alanine ligase
VTNVGVSHLEVLGSRDAIAEAKAELVEALPADGRAVLNADDDYFHVLASRSAAPVLSFGTEEGADVRVSGSETDEQGRLTFRLSGQLIAADVAMPITGRHHALNAAAAAAAALAAGAPPEWVVSGLAGYGGGVMRGQVLPAPGGFTVLDDSYNAAPDSMRAAHAMLADLPAARRWAVLGDMKELGDATIEQHHVLGHEVAATGIAGLVTVGELGRYIGEGAREAGLATVVETEDNAAAAAALLARVAPGDAVLVKGSRAMQMEAIVNALLAREGGGAHG